MNADHAVTDEEVEAVIAQGREIRRAPDVVRARLLARARAAVAAAERSRASFGPLLDNPAPRRGRWIAVAATVLLALGAAGATAALYTRARLSGAPATPPLRTPAKPAALQSEPGPPTPAATPPPATRKPRRARAFMSPQESYAAELALLQRAQSEYASQDFPDALVLVAEHARRFPSGRLAEEREALRVRSLAGANRGDGARRALATFARRFPHSVLLPRLQEVARTAED